MPRGVQERVLGFLASPDSGAFEALALDVFRFQYENNPALRRWCEACGVSPASVGSAAGIPAVPTAAFKELEFCCGAPVAEFRTSGTTGPGAGRHLLPSLEPYRASAMAQFGRCVSPEGWKLRTLALAPPPRLSPASSLSQMLAWVLEEFGGPGSGWFVSERGLEREKLAEVLLDARSAGSQVLLAGTTAAFLAFYDFCDAEGLRLELPSGSRLMDTGGRKGSGRAEDGPLAEFQAAFRKRTVATLGISEEQCVNEYGMTEMCSQFYDSVIMDRHAGTKREGSGRVKALPPWVMTAAVNPVTLEVLPPGETGLLRHVDLANVGSVIGVLTEDLGRTCEGGFVLEGRPRAAEARGCGMTFEEFSREGASRP